MSAEDYFDGRDPWEDDDNSSYSNYKESHPKRYRCKYCNKEGLKWRSFGNDGYKLVSQIDETKIHICRDKHGHI